ncbi:ENR1 protein, partial [Baryphthengus martii]|nr:ENR1 protein [Baryphthengus martii]
LAEKVAEELNVTDRWVCGGLPMSEEWPWKETDLDPSQIIKWNYSVISGETKRPVGCALVSDTLGTECLERRGNSFNKWARETPCKRTLIHNGTRSTWWPEEPSWHCSRENAGHRT